jgi:hypothetical protein
MHKSGFPHAYSVLIGLLVISLSLIGCDPAPEICQRIWDVPRDECIALQGFFESTGGPGWKGSRGWLVDENVCRWYGVKCEAGRVIGIALNFNDLTGNLNYDLSNLASLKLLSLYYNELEGRLPDWLGAMDALEVLILHNNHIDGPIPVGFRSMRSLRVLDLDRNNLSGALPASLGDLEALHTLKLRANDITGQLPVELAHCENLLCS